MTATAAHDRLSRARLSAILRRPFLGHLLLEYEFRESAEVETVATDGTAIQYNPGFVQSLTVEQAEAVLCHEVLHLVLNHLSRRSGRVHALWNLATDVAINNELIQLRFQLPPDSVTDVRHHGKSAEQIYAALTEGRADGNDPHGCGDRCGGRECQASPSPGERFGRSSDSRAHTRRPIAPFPSLGEPGPSWDDHSLWPGDAADSRRLRVLEEKARQALLRANAAAARSHGMDSVPPSCRRLLGRILQPRLPWREQLRQTIRDYGFEPDDYDGARPNAKYLSQGLYLPRIKTDAVRDVFIAVDTSASIREAQLESFVVELAEILSCAQSVQIMTCDTEPRELHDFDGGEALAVVLKRLQFKGGGGTDFRPAFEAATAQNPAPRLMVFFTDLMGRFPAEPPDFPVLWVVCRADEPYGECPAPPFGEWLELPADPQQPDTGDY